MCVWRVYSRIAAGVGVMVFIGLWLTNPSWAGTSRDRLYLTNNLFQIERNPYKPRTMAGVYHAYFSLVYRKNGVDLAEARIIAQYWLIEDDHYRNFDFRKPKLIADESDIFKIRFPGKFSLTKKKTEIFVYCVDKKTGKILCSYPSL